MKDEKGKKKSEIKINDRWCKGCYICIEACPKKVLEKSKSVSDKGFNPVAVARPEQCTRCLQCEMLCPDLAIHVQEVEESPCN